MVKSIDQLPLIRVPEDYPFVMPWYLAQVAMEHGPIFRIDWTRTNWPQMRNAVCMIGPEANKAFYHTNERNLSHEKGWVAIIQSLVGKGLLNMDQPEHLYYRRIINPLMTARHIADQFAMIYETIQQHISAWEDGMVVDLYAELRSIAFTVIAKLLCGMENAGDIERLCDAFHRLMTPHQDPSIETREQFLERFRAQDEIDHSLCSQIVQRRKGSNGADAEHSEDLIDLLLRAHTLKDQPLRREEMLGHLRVMLTAGHDTTVVTGASLLYLLATHPAYLERVFPEFDLLPDDSTGPGVLEQLKDMRLLGYALQEAGRMYGPAGNMPRHVSKEFEFGGYLVPAGEFVLLSIAGGNWLPSVYTHPERFDPDRFAPPREEDKRYPCASINFASGTRMCVGVHLAQIELKTLATLVLRSWELEPTGQDITVAYFGPDGMMPYGLKMRVRRRRDRRIDN